MAVKMMYCSEEMQRPRTPPGKQDGIYEVEQRLLDVEAGQLQGMGRQLSCHAGRICLTRDKPVSASLNRFLQARPKLTDMPAHACDMPTAVHDAVWRMSAQCPGSRRSSTPQNRPSPPFSLGYTKLSNAYPTPLHPPWALFPSWLLIIMITGRGA